MNTIAIDMGGTRIKAGLLVNKQLAAWQILEANSSQGLESHLPLIDENIHQLTCNHHITSVDGIVMAFPGIVDPRLKKVISTSKKYEDAPGLNLSAYYAEKWKAAFFLENDARLACIGEWKYGAGRNFTDMVMCTLGTGFGSSAIVNGKILRGHHYQAGILGGHSIIDFSNHTHQCSCGKYGCVEAMASTWNMSELAKKHPGFKESKLAAAAKIDWPVINEYRKQGDAVSLLLYEHCLQVWSAGITNLIHAYDPQAVIVGGGIMHTADDLKPALEIMISKRVWSPSGMPEIKAAQFPDVAALLGSTIFFEK